MHSVLSIPSYGLRFGLRYGYGLGGLRGYVTFGLSIETVTT